MKKKYVISLFALMAIFYGYSRIYVAPSFSGVVEDAATGKPVPGAVVVATWHSQSPGFHSAGNELFEIQEVLTDAEGRFVIEGWGLKILYRLLGAISMDQPKLLVYKYGYEPTEFWNRYPSDNHTQNRHGLTIEWYSEKLLNIQTLVGTKNEKILQFKDKRRKINLIYMCELEKIKMLLLEVDKQFLDIELSNFNATSMVTDLQPWFTKNIYSAEDEKCVRVVQFLVDSRNNLKRR